MGEAAVLRILRNEGGGEMSTSCCLVQTEPTPLYGRVRVAQSSAGETSLWHYDDDPEWVDADGDWCDVPDVTRPATVADLKALVATRRYRFVDEYGEGHDVLEVFGE